MATPITISQPAARRSDMAGAAGTEAWPSAGTVTAAGTGAWAPVVTVTAAGASEVSRSVVQITYPKRATASSRANVGIRAPAAAMAVPPAARPPAVTEG